MIFSNKCTGCLSADSLPNKPQMNRSLLCALLCAILFAGSLQCDKEQAAQLVETVQTMYWETEKLDIRSHMEYIVDCTFIGLYGTVSLKINDRTFMIEKKVWKNYIRVEMITNNETCQEFSLDWCFKLFWKFKALLDIKDKTVTIDEANWEIESNHSRAMPVYGFCHGPMSIEGDSKTYMASIDFGYFDSLVRAGLAYEHEEARNGRARNRLTDHVL